MTEQICVHTNDKEYNLRDTSKVKTSSVSFADTIKHSTKFHPDALGSRVWSGDEIVYWKMDTDYPFIEGVILEQELCKLAFLETSIQTNLVIRQRKRSSADAQIRINWLGKKDESFFTSDSILAFAYGPGRGIGGNITMNADVPWGLNGEIINGKQFEDRFDRPANPDGRYKVYDALHTMKHEGGGHSCGCPHVTTVADKFKAIMYPYYNGLRRFGSADLAMLWDFYEKASLNHRIKEMLLARIGKGVMA